MNCWYFQRNNIFIVSGNNFYFYTHSEYMYKKAEFITKNKKLIVIYGSANIPSTNLARKLCHRNRESRGSVICVYRDSRARQRRCVLYGVRYFYPRSPHACIHLIRRERIKRIARGAVAVAATANLRIHIGDSTSSRARARARHLSLLTCSLHYPANLPRRISDGHEAE